MTSTLDNPRIAAGPAVAPTRIPPFASLDAFRGLAALYVLIFHASFVLIPRFPRLAAHPAHKFASFGYLGVEIFFVISGYCITHAAFADLSARRPLSKYLTARAYRIFPPYLCSFAAFAAASLVSSFLIARGVLKSSSLAQFNLVHLSPKFFVANLTLTAPYLHQPFLSVVAWTLAYELSFYAVVALALLAAARARPAIFFPLLHCLTLASLVALLLLPTGRFFPLDMWPMFGLGVLVFDITHSPSPRLPILFVVASLLLLLAHAYLHPATIGYANEPSRHTLLTAAAFATFLLPLKRFDAPFSAAPPVRALAFVGRFSYSLYLIHFLVVAAAIQILARTRLLPAFHLPVFAALVLAGLAGGYLFYLACERPFLRRRRKSLSPTPPPGPTPAPASVLAT